MNEEHENKLIKEFLMKVKSKLPAWLVNNEEDLNEVLNELNEHIKDKVETLVAKGEPILNATRIAISEMGDPVKIAKEYKRRGTPKYYITEELWPTYKLSLKILFSLIIVINSVVQTFKGITAALTGGNWLACIFEGLNAIIIGMAFVFTGATLVFVGLSMEGFFLEDIKDIFKSKEELKEKRQKLKEAKISKTETEKLIGTKPKGIPGSIELILGGCFELLIGVIFMLQPFAILNMMINPQFLTYLTVFGVIVLIEGCFSLTEGIFSTLSYKANKYLTPIRIAISFMILPVLILIMMNPQIVPIIFWSETTGLAVIQIPLEFYGLFYFIMTVIIIGIIASNIKDLYYVIKLNPNEYSK